MPLIGVLHPQPVPGRPPAPRVRLPAEAARLLRAQRALRAVMGRKDGRRRRRKGAFYSTGFIARQEQITNASSHRH